MYRYITLFILLFVIQNSIFFANGQPKKFGDISKSDFKEITHSRDSSASAVVLFEKGEATFTPVFDVNLKYHARIKIVNTEGYEWATIEVPFNKEADQHVRKIKGTTYELTEDGEIVETKLSSDAIFEEEVTKDGFRKIKFTMPALKPGVIIEYEYLKNTGPFYSLPDWSFQREIPVIWSEYETYIPEYFEYSLVLRGFLPLNSSENEAINYGGHKVSKNTYVMQDIPALEEKPYISSLENYRSRILAQLSKIHIPNRFPSDFLKTWEDVWDELESHIYFGRELSKNKFTDKVETIIQNETNQLKQIQLLFDYVSEQFEWDGQYGLFVDNDLKEVFKAKHGSGVELNLLLTQVFRDAGFKSYPVLVSTRDHGLVLPNYPIVSQFNHVITVVEVEGQKYPLDATSGQQPITLLAEKNINGSGLIIGDKGPSWLSLEPMQDTKQRVLITAAIDNSGKISGSYQVSAQGYFAHDMRKNYSLEPEEVAFVAANINTGMPEAQFKNVEVDIDKSQLEKFNCSFEFSHTNKNEVRSMGEFIYFNPLFFMNEQTNPFTEPARSIPVEFSYPFSKSYYAQLTIPEGYEIEDLPESKIISLPGNKGQIKRIIQAKENTISVILDYKISRTFFSPGEYPYIKEFFRQYLNIQDERVVLKKSA